MISNNVYVLEFSKGLDISLSFDNVSNLYKYEEGLTSGWESTIDWKYQLSGQPTIEIIEVLDERDVG